MADIDVVQKPAGNLTWVWALVAILAVGGLLVWLAVQSERVTTAAVVQEDAPGRGAAAAPAAGDAEPAELGEVAAAPDPFIGRRLRFEEVEVAASLGPSAFWGNVPGANPFLVVFSPNVTEQPQLESGQTFTIQGVINEVNEAALDEWVQSGAIRPGARDEAGFATHYLLAEQINR
jgi:hypothetical protein